jgi:hypothetical protein
MLPIEFLLCFMHGEAIIDDQRRFILSMCSGFTCMCGRMDRCIKWIDLKGLLVICMYACMYVCNVVF